MKILVTGASGFIGSAFAGLALSRGHEILGLVSPSGREPPSLVGRPGLRWLRSSLAELRWSEVEDFGPDVCVHAAWIATPGLYLDSSENEAHREWSLGLARGLRRLGMRHFVGVGTCIEYRISGAPLNEASTPLEPTWLYARCKNAVRATLEAEALQDGSLFCWGRVFYPFGVGEHPARLCTSLVQKLRAGERVELKTPDSTKDYIYIDDLASAMLLTVEKKVAGPINWGTGIGVSVRQIADAIAAMLGRPELVSNSPQLASDALSYVVADGARLRGLGWEPAFDLQAGLENLLRHLSQPGAR
jgi:nucleoside-diphosphate-sugar epimerase